MCRMMVMTMPSPAPPMQMEGEKSKEEVARKKAEEEAKLDARRAAIRERIAKQHEIAARMAMERQAAEERAKAEAGKFRGKPLYEKLMEDYEQNKEREVGAAGAGGGDAGCGEGVLGSTHCGEWQQGRTAMGQQGSETKELLEREGA